VPAKSSLTPIAARKKWNRLLNRGLSWIWMKGSFMKILESLLGHWVIVLFGSGGIIATLFGRFYRTCLKGWLVPLFSKKQPIYSEEGNIKTVLKGILGRLTEGDELRETIVYKDWDRKYNIEKGGTKRYFKTVLSEFDIWSIESEGEDIILIVRDIPEDQLFTE
jgi:hypothetical protein